MTIEVCDEALRLQRREAYVARVDGWLTEHLKRSAEASSTRSRSATGTDTLWIQVVIFTLTLTARLPQNTDVTLKFCPCVLASRDAWR